MYKRKCPVCGKKFKTEYERKTYCSTKCYDKYYRETHPKVKEKPYLKCPACGKEFLRETSGQKYCSKECRLKDYYKNKNPEKEIVCECCGKTFTTNYKKKYCSEKCRRIANSPSKKLPKRNSRKRNNFISLNEAARLSKETGLSYGKLVERGLI